MKLSKCYKTLGLGRFKKRILYTLKATPSAMLDFMKGVDFVGERLPFVNEFVAIIVCKGRK